MSEEILINTTPRETRVALVENGVLQEIFVERASNRGIVGNIYMGSVVRVLPGMQAAFVDIGLSKAAFLHASDMMYWEPPDDIEEDSDVQNIPVQFSRSNECISEMLTEGQSIVVQVTKDPLGSKGARLTTRISIASRYLVFMPELDHVGLSLRIEDEAERSRLKSIVEAAKGNGAGGYIIRTAAEGALESELMQSMRYLGKLWGILREREATAKPGDLIFDDLPLVTRALRDVVSAQTERVRIDDETACERARVFAEKYIPDLVPKIELYELERPIFDIYGIEDEIQKALHKKVQLKSGGYLIVDQTEAMTTIDVNTGAFVGSRNLDETIFKTNLEATHSIGRQLKLRNLGGIIIIDFIDMNNAEHKRQVIRALEKALSRDKAKTTISEVSSLGLVEMTRKRTRESLERVLCEPCGICGGRGSVKTSETICNEIFREIIREERAFDAHGFLVLASQAVVDRMLDEDSSAVAELSDLIGKPVTFQVEALYSQEQYDVVMM